MERWGSSPLARGPQYGFVWSSYCPGLIPARAGTTCVMFVFAALARAHPRSRGDHDLVYQYSQVFQGSSPLARGPLPDFAAKLDGLGLIPARAGTTGWVREDGQLYGAHPRSRGDHNRGNRARFRGGGSSPLARGPLGRRGSSWPPGGLIPARAGTTSFRRRARSSSRAHPRSRGDHSVRQMRRDPAGGSSPLARGPLGL